MSKFFLKRGEEIRGPLSLARLKELADTGQLCETDLVGRDESGVFTAITHYFKVDAKPNSEVIGSNAPAPDPASPKSPTRVPGQAAPPTQPARPTGVPGQAAPPKQPTSPTRVTGQASTPTQPVRPTQIPGQTATPPRPAVPTQMPRQTSHVKDSNAVRVQTSPNTAKVAAKPALPPLPSVAPTAKPVIKSTPVAAPISGPGSHRLLWVFGGIAAGTLALLIFGLILGYSGIFSSSADDVAQNSERRNPDTKTSTSRPQEANSTPKQAFVVPETLEKIPANFESFTLRELAQELKEQVKTREKGEFEKTTDWLESQKNLWASSRIYNQPCDSRFIYCFRDKFFEFEYDPDSELTSVKLSEPKVVEVKGDVMTTWRFGNFPDTAWRELNWDCNPASAKEQSANLGIAIVFTMGLPVLRDSESDVNKFSPLIEDSTFFRSLVDGRASVGVDKGIWIDELSQVIAFRKDTGEIIARKDLAVERYAKRLFSNNKHGLFGELAFNSDSSLIASSHKDGVLEIAEVESGKILTYLNGHMADIQGIDFHPEKQWLVSGSADGTAKVWDVASGEVLKELAVHKDDINTIKFSHDGKLIASGGSEGLLRIFEVASGNLLKTITTHRQIKFGAANSSDTYQAIKEIAFSPDDRLIATVGYGDDPVLLLDLNRGKRIGAFPADKDYTDSVVFTPDGRYLITGGYDGDVYVWDTLAVTEGPTIEELWEKVPADVQPDDWSSLSTRSTKDRLKFLQRFTGDSDFDLSDVAKAEGRAKTFEVGGKLNTVRISPDGTTVTAMNDRTVSFFDFETGKKIKEHDLGLYTRGQDIEFSQDGQWLAVKTTTSGVIFHLETLLQTAD